MDSLYKFLVENFDLIGARRAILGALINNKKKPGDEDSLKKVRAMFYALTSQLKTEFETYCCTPPTNDGGGLGFNKDQFRAVWQIFMQYDAYHIAQTIIDQDGIIEPKAILNTTSPSDLSSVISSDTEIETLNDTGNKVKEKLGIGAEMIKELIETQPSKGGITVGPGELFLCLFVKKCRQNPDKKGDLLIGGTNLEVKGNMALLQGQSDKSKAQGRNFYRNFDDFCMHRANTLLNPESGFGSTEDLEKLIGNQKEEDRDPLLKIWLEYRSDEDDIFSGKKKVKKILKALKSAGVDIIEFTKYLLVGDGQKETTYYEDDCGITDDYMSFLQRHKTDIENDADNWLRAITLYGALIYKRAEQFDSIIMVNNVTKKFMVINMADNSQYDQLWQIAKEHWQIRTGISAKDTRMSLPKITLKG